MVNVSKMVQMLLDRMDKFPDEFVSPCYSATKQYSRDLIEDARWGYVSIAILDTAAQSQGLFTAEECNAYRDKIMKILRKKYEADVCEELVRPTEQEQADPRQGQLWQTQTVGSSNTSITANQITSEALKILEQELYKNNKPTKLII
jgi:hypothetical protein